MSRWVIKWNRNDAAAGALRDWAVGMSRRSVECYGRAEGRGGENLSNVSPGNVALAFQVDERAFYGVIRVITVQSSAKPAYFLADSILRFPRPVKLSTLEANEPLLAEASAFHAGGIESVRRLSPDEYRLILAGCGVDAATRARLNI